MEQVAIFITNIISHAVEILSAVIIGIAVIKTLYQYIQQYINKNKGINPEQIRVQFGSAVAVSLELLLGADVLSTAVSPGWDDIGKLAAIALIRTILNYFLERELKHMHTARVSTNDIE
ncbi:MAG: DUF1622 domain-containing protein [Ferruginibacter sp.]